MSTKKTVTETKLGKKPVKEEAKKEEAPSQFAAKKVGSNLIVTIGTERYSRKVTSEEWESISKKILLYNKKPSEASKRAIVKILQPATTKDKEAKEVAETKIKGLEKQLKKKGKEEVKVAAKAKKVVKSEANKSTSEGAEMIAYTKTGIALVGFEKITMPELLVAKITTFLKENLSIKPLINFWLLCLQNPNEIARTRLFQYLSHHSFIITPSGYFVTYRLVKKTNDKNVFTDAHTGKFRIKIGEVVSIPRSECDEDGSRDCSKGLHVGSPSFIGVAKGEGYDKQQGHIGTGYVSDRSSNTGLGDQAIIAFVNPAHVVSIPDSDTRKLRTSEYYPFKLTTAEEIISVEDSDYHVYENDYKKVELEQLMQSVDKDALKEYFGGSKDADTAKLQKLKETLNANIAKVAKDTMATSLSLDEVKLLVSNRVTLLTEKHPTGVQL